MLLTHSEHDRILSSCCPVTVSNLGGWLLSFYPENIPPDMLLVLFCNKAQRILQNDHREIKYLASYSCQVGELGFTL